MKKFSDYAVVYDISCNRERRVVEKIIKGFGFRIQKSVFECRMDNVGLKELVNKLTKANIETGFVKIYRMVFLSKNQVIGISENLNHDHNPAFIV